MPLNIDHDFRVELYEAFKEAGTQNIKQLDQKERKFLMAAFRSLSLQPNVSFSISETNKLIIDNIKQKLNATSTSDDTSNFIIKLLKGIGNIIGFRMSSNMLKTEFKNVGIPGQINKTIADIVATEKALEEMNKMYPKAKEHYESMVTFFENLPKDMDSAIPLIKDRMNEITEKVLPPITEQAIREFEIQHNRKPKEPDPNKKGDKGELKGGVLSIVRDEILSSLKSMANFKEQTIKTLVIQFESELIKEEFEKNGISSEFGKRDISKLPSEKQEEIKAKVKAKKEELNSDKGKNELQKAFARDIGLQIQVYSTALGKLKTPDNAKQEANGIISELKSQLEELRSKLEKIKKTKIEE